MVSRVSSIRPRLEYDGTVSRLLGDMPENEESPWEWVVDNTRWRRAPPSFGGLSEAVSIRWRPSYRRDLWKDAEHYVEIWVEKDPLAGVLVEETVPPDVPLMVAKGYTSKFVRLSKQRRTRLPNKGRRLHLPPR